MKLKTCFSLAIAVLCALTTSAAEDLPKTLMTERGKLLCSEDFATLDAKTWHAAKGKWEIADGGLKGVELKPDKHPAVIRRQFPFKNAVIQFEVQVNGCKQTTFSINEAKAHLARALFTPAGFAAQKDDQDHDGPDKAVRFATLAAPMKSGEWHTVVMEFLGEEMVTTMDGKTIAGAHPALAKEKANFGFTVAGESGSYRNLRVWEAKPNPAWEQNKKQIPAAKK
ncbi:MAG: hypothetical protein NTY01_20980 [Verrucomicrobia bacterium]|nr:hypothetical protein [Verrucomicrobiota bacterium]